MLIIHLANKEVCVLVNTDTVAANLTVLFYYTELREYRKWGMWRITFWQN